MMMFNSLLKQVREKLWSHQAEALRFAIDHLNARSSPCLVRMPTGTGKTGVIACLTRLSNSGSSLVLTPWANLREQMIHDLDTGFWQIVGIQPGQSRVVKLLPSSANRVLTAKEPQVIVSTFTTLNELRRENETVYKQLANSISLVVADECHYEPAVEWGKSVKNLKCRTVLLTATPYRNDLKLFRISDPKRSAHHFTHALAIRRNIIRELAFEELASAIDIPALAAAFTRQWRAAKSAQTLPVEDARAIVCCSGATEIEAAVNRLRAAGLSAIGIHEQFEKSKKPHLLYEVPDPKVEKAEIWVHQHKLTEGLDDHRFCAVALFTRIRNDRKLIQQIGRILRRKHGDRDAPALLLAPAEFSVEAEWGAYLEFETKLKLLEPAHFREVVRRLLKSQPDVEYFEGRFRRRFDPGKLETAPQVVISPSVLVRATKDFFSLEQYIEDCTDTLNTEDAVILGRHLDAPCQRADNFALWIYASVRNSRLLKNTSLYEVRLETHCVVLADGYVLIADSRGILPWEYLDEHTAAVPQEKLARFIDTTFRPTHVSVDSSIPYDTVLRGSDMRGHNLLSVPATLTDRIQICRSARGASKKFGRRYLGMFTGRLRKEETAEERRSFEPRAFVAWAQSVAKVLDSSSTASALFQRYMRTCEPPASPVPRTICVDLLRLNLDLTLSDGEECTLKSLSANISKADNGGGNRYSVEFDVEANGSKPEALSLGIVYDEDKRRFWFSKEDGPAVQVNLPGDSQSKNLAEFLNQNQDNVLIGLDGGEMVYQGRNFYRIDYNYAERSLLGLISRPKNSGRYRTEKGTKEQLEEAKEQQSTRFPVRSLFRAIADQHLPFPFANELAICADMGTECADFVIASFENRELSLVHAKAGSGTEISASAFHEVVAQAMKNLVYLTRNAEVPKGVGSWLPGGKWNRTGVPRLYRIVDGLPSRAALWKKLKSDIVEDSNPRLFVTLVTTGCCDLNKLREAIEQPSKRTPEVAQFLHLLDGINGHARQLGVRLLVYDLPYYED